MANKLTKETISRQKTALKDIRENLGLSLRGLDYFLSLGVTDPEKRGNISYRKELPVDSKYSMSPSKMQMLAMGLLEFIAQEGYDINTMQFEEGVCMTKGPAKLKRKRKAATSVAKD